MHKSLLLTCIFVLAASIAVFAQGYSVTYCDGTVEVKGAKGWASVAIGDQVAANASVRVSDNGSVELLKGKSKISIVRDGTYALADLSRASSKSGGGGVGSSLSQKLSSLTTESRKSTTVAGVRGAEQGSGGSVMWVEENEETRGRVNDLLAKKKYAEAAKLLDQAIRESSVDAEKNEYGYMLGVAYYGAGETVKAYRAISKVTVQPEDAYYPKYILLKSQILIDSTAFDEALEALKAFIAENPKGEATQMAHLLSAYCYRGLGNEKSAKASLETGLALDPASETGKTISEELKK